MAAPPSGGAAFKDALLAEIRKSKVVFYNTVVAQAQRIDVAVGKVSFTFSPNQRTIRDMFEQNRSWLESLAEKIGGRKTIVESAQADAGPPAGGTRAPAAVTTPTPTSGGTGAAVGSESARPGPDTSGDRKTALKEKALADAGVQALLEVFPAEIRDVEEM
jgi:hypothetical protein